ncbi:MAG: type II toxin-antitoxin system RelE/ParE family toxin [Bryobacteraceae bacterium]
MIAYELHPEVRRDLDKIWDFIAKNGVDAADNVIGDILDRIDALVAFPHQGHKRRDLTSRPLRFIAIRDYLIAYAPDERPIYG